MNDTFEKVEGLTEHVKEYVQNRIEQAKLEIAEKTARSKYFDRELIS